MSSKVKKKTKSSQKSSSSNGASSSFRDATAAIEASNSLQTVDSLSVKAGSMAESLDRYGGYRSSTNKKKKKKVSMVVNGNESNKSADTHHKSIHTDADSATFADISLDTIYSASVTRASRSSRRTAESSGDFVQQLIRTTERYTPSKRKRRRLLKNYGPGLLLFVTLLIAHFMIRQSLRVPGYNNVNYRSSKSLSGNDVMTLNSFMETTLRKGGSDLPTNQLRQKQQHRHKDYDKQTEQQMTQRQQERLKEKENTKKVIQEIKKSKITLINAVRENDFDKVKLLLSKGMNPNKEDSETGITPFIEAILSNNDKMVVAMMRHGAKSQPPPGFSHSPLRAAALMGNYRLVQLLIKTMADPNAKSKGGRTPLMGACYLRPDVDDALSMPTVAALLEDPRTNPWLRNDANETAMDLCRKRDYKKSMQLLSVAMDNFNKKQKKKWSSSLVLF